MTPEPGAAAPATAAVNGLGLDLLRRNLGVARGNVALSPWSIATALAMTRLGARAATATEMDRVLHADASLAACRCTPSTARVASRNAADAVELAAANRVFAQRSLTLEQPFTDDLARHFGSSVGRVDYKQATEAARKEINAWVSEQTRSGSASSSPPGSWTRTAAWCW